MAARKPDVVKADAAALEKARVQQNKSGRPTGALNRQPPAVRSPVVAMVVPVVTMMPAVPAPVMADAARTVVGQDDAATAIGIIIVGRVIGPVVIGAVEVPMVVRS